ncbi:MAG TPA: CARDB domain-containing protein [Thermoleophilaceae bacterium]|nr:CARDB domain-containing protein [Thermoleophilaceae bacterium]
MLRRPLIAAVLASAALTASAHAAFPDSGQMSSPSAWVKVSSCSRSAHTAAFYSRAHRLAPGQRMWMRFTLLQRGADGHYTPVAAPALKRWRKSKPGVKAFGYRQRVRALSPDSAYRARVDYRWYDSDGTLDHKARRRSGVCSQTGPLPNLRARITGSSATDVASLRRYTVRLANAGDAAADDAQVRFSVAGESSEVKTVTHLAASDFAIVSFKAPPCISGVRAQADPNDLIKESVETDNDQRLSCDQIPAH